MSNPHYTPFTRQEQNEALFEQSQRERETQARLKPLDSINSLSEILEEQKVHQKQIEQAEAVAAEKRQRQKDAADAADAAFRNWIFEVESAINQMRHCLHSEDKFQNANRLNELKALFESWSTENADER